MRDPDCLSRELLDWYDANARALPWRVPPAARQDGVMPDPYRVWLSEVMLQQTTVAAVKAYFNDFTTRWPTVRDLAAADDAVVMAAWAGLGYYARARNLLKCARAVSDDLGGGFPAQEAELLKLPGIGPYTAAAIAAIAFDRPATVLDGNVERVMARLFAIKDPLPASKETLRALAASLTPKTRSGDYAQAVMDLGATICTPRNPACGICPVQSDCQARAQGIASDLPRKTPKKPKPIRRGIAYLLRRTDGAILLETRPDKGLLGGMQGLPCSEWHESEPVAAPPVSTDWVIATDAVRHTFTHFHLKMDVHIGEVPPSAVPDRGIFVAAENVSADDLPTVMRKALKIGLSHLNRL